MKKMLDDAIAYAVKMHAGTCDRLGVPYIAHPMAVMRMMKSTEDRIVAILHDLIEDTEATPESIREAVPGIPDSLIDTILVLTRKPGESYEAYLQSIAKDMRAVRVKLGDLHDNLAPFRAEGLTPSLEERYRRAVDLLEPLAEQWTGSES